jgi:hypothetical protein
VTGTQLVRSMCNTSVRSAGDAHIPSRAALFPAALYMCAALAAAIAMPARLSAITAPPSDVFEYYVDGHAYDQPEPAASSHRATITQELMRQLATLQGRCLPRPDQLERNDRVCDPTICEGEDDPCDGADEAAGLLLGLCGYLQNAVTAAWADEETAEAASACLNCLAECTFSYSPDARCVREL